MSEKNILRIMKNILLKVVLYALSAWNFRASECRAELVRAMPSAAENLEEEAQMLHEYE